MPFLPKMKNDYLTQSFALGGITDTTMVMLFWGVPDFAQDAAGLWKRIHTLVQMYYYYRSYSWNA